MAKSFMTKAQVMKLIKFNNLSKCYKWSFEYMGMDAIYLSHSTDDYILRICPMAKNGVIYHQTMAVVNERLVVDAIDGKDKYVISARQFEGWFKYQGIALEKIEESKAYSTACENVVERRKL